MKPIGGVYTVALNKWIYNYLIRWLNKALQHYFLTATVETETDGGPGRWNAA